MACGGAALRSPLTVIMGGPDKPGHDDQKMGRIAKEGPPSEAPQGRRMGGDRTATRNGIRCGCCLPALTRLAKRPPAADLREGIWRMGRAEARGRARLLVRYAPGEDIGAGSRPGIPPGYLA